MSEKDKKTQAFIIGRRYVSRNNEEENSNEEIENIYLTDKTREGSLMVVGTKGSGKSQHIIPMLFRQDIRRKDMGVTVVCGTKDLAYTLYTMAKLEKRKVILLKPSTNSEVLNSLITETQWNYNYINDNIINYKKAIKDKTVVIIDMEYDFYRQDAIRASAMLLLQLQTDMCLTQETKKQKHSVYIDDAQNYLPFIDMLIKCGSNYNIINTLFFQGRNQFKIGKKDYTSLIDNNVQSTILLNTINFDDAKYYAEKYCPRNMPVKNFLTVLMNMPFSTFTYEVYGTDFKRKVGSGVLAKIPEDEMNIIVEKSIKTRKKLIKYNKEAINTQLLQPEIAELYYLTPRNPRNQKNKNINTTENKTVDKNKKEQSTTVSPKEAIDNFSKLTNEINKIENSENEKQVNRDIDEINVYDEQEKQSSKNENKKQEVVETEAEVENKTDNNEENKNDVAVEVKEELSEEEKAMQQLGNLHTEATVEVEQEENSYSDVMVDDTETFEKQMSQASEQQSTDPIVEEQEKPTDEVQEEEEFNLNGHIEISSLSTARVNRPIKITFPSIQNQNSIKSLQDQYNKMFNNL